MHVKVLIMSMFISVITLNGMAQAKENSPSADTTGTNTLLWRISGNGLSAPSYLFGTMHLMCAQDAVLSDSLKKAISVSLRVYFEIDMDDLKELMAALRFGRMTGGQKISDLLSPQQYQHLSDYFARHPAPVPLSMMDRFKPLLVSSLISEQFMDCSNKVGMEQVIMKEAKEDGKEIRGLETSEYQAGLFDSIPYHEQALELLEYVDSIDKYRENSREMVEVYRQQNLRKLDSLVQGSDPGMDKYMDLLLYNRNRHWAKQMTGLMQQGSLLFAVGAGHIVGSRGLIQLLREEGYTVSPVPNRWP